ncbi:MAG: hypothetical protein ACTSV3_02095 [Candidatus Thorarchaeota archaeon]|nr:MAG: hypothetical protein DRP09_12010 [Candidatus Thorarchaeota archaeon]RLI58090.1 MAG: hypothetical protein DRO87_06260 [Candidatus Thorarchaeota archaeon]
MPPEHHRTQETIKRMAPSEVEVSSTESLRRRMLSQVKTPYDSLLRSSDRRVQYYLDLIKIRIALSSGALRLRDAYAAISLLEEDPEFGISGTFGPLPESWSPKMIQRLIKNLRILRRTKVMGAQQIYSAIIDMLTFHNPHDPPRGRHRDVFAYFVHHPLATFSHAARDLQCHRSTIKTAYSALLERYHIMALGLLNGCAFGIQTFILFFELKEKSRWEHIRDKLLSFRFTKTLHRVTTSPLGFVSFAIPACSSNIAEMRSGVERISEKLFNYSSLHMMGTIARYVNPHLLKDGTWCLPDSLKGKVNMKSRSPEPASAIVSCPRYVEGLTREDFYVSEVAGYYLRDSATKIANIMSDRGHEMFPSQVAYRRAKLLRKGVMAPWLWFGRAGLHYNFCVEIVCDEDMRERVFSMVSDFPEVFISKSDRGVILWLETPRYHLKEYYRFLSSLTDMQGVERVNPILAVMRSGGKNYIDIFDGLKFGRQGFTHASHDVDIAEHVL